MATYNPNAMHDEIRDGVRAGVIPREWRRADISVYLRDRGYSDNSISTIPANNSITKDRRIMGNYVKRGMTPRYYRLGDGLYQLIDD